jgi:hypothetical protein
MRPRIFIIAGAASIVLSSHAQAAAVGGVRVVRGAETAQVRHNHLLAWKPLAANGRVPAGAEVTCDRICAVQVDSDNTVELTPGAVISVGQFFYVPLVAGAASLTPAHEVELREGTIEAFSPSERAVPLVISVGAVEHVALSGARVQVSALPEHTSVGVISGQARVGANRSWVTLDKGLGSTVTMQGRPSAPRALLAGPKWATAGGSCPAGLSVSEPDGRVVVGGCWDKMPEAGSYRVEVASDAGFQKLVQTPDLTTVSSWSTILGVGRYFARVRAIDGDGLWGEASGARKLAVIPCVLPPGAMANMETRTLIVPEGREISFGDPAGLELAIDKGGFMRAPKSIFMDAEPSHELRFRLKDDQASASTVYIARRRALRADVQMMPRKAEWPTNPIEITVTLVDPSGQVDTSKVDAQLKVLIDLNEVQVRWSRQGAVYRGHLDPRQMGGPTVIRVIASDEHGTQIGRNFLEIDHKAPHFASDTMDGRRIAHK